MTFDRERLPEPIAYFESRGLRLSSRGKWRTTECQFHGGSDSMRINTQSGGWCCMACDAKGGDVLAYHMKAYNMDFMKAAQELGAWVEDGKAPAQYKPTPLPARAALQVLAFEALLVATAAGNVARGVKLTEQDRLRLLAAAGRINCIAEAYQ